MKRALGIVLVGAGRAEHGHDRVPDELLDEAVVALDRSRQLPEQVALEGADLLRVERLRERGESRQVREQDGDQPPVALLGPSGGRSGDPCARAPGGGRQRARRRGDAAASLPPHLGQKAKSAWTADPHPGQVMARPSLLHVAGAPQRGVDVVRARASRGRAGLCTIGFHRVPHRHQPLKEIAPRCSPTPWVTCSTSLSVSRPSSVAVIQGDTTLTYADLDGWCNRAANALAGLGVRAGHRVALMFSNDWRFLPAFLGPMRIGAVSVPLNIRMGDEALAYVIQDAEATVLIAGRDQAERARRLASQVKGLAHVVADAPPADGAVEWDAWLAAASPRFRRRRIDPDSVCMQPYTSGSTGKPKGVLLAHRGQIWNADIIRKMACLDDTERALVAVPLYHKNAMIGAVKPFLLAGGSLVILPGFDPVEVIRAIDRHQVTYLTGVPAMYMMMLAEKETLARHSVRSIRYALCGSAEVPEELLIDFQRVFGAPIGESYGLTEGGPVPMANPRYGLKKLGSCGVDVQSCENRIVSTADGITDCAVDEVGELVTRNPGSPRGSGSSPR